MYTVRGQPPYLVRVPSASTPSYAECAMEWQPFSAISLSGLALRYTVAGWQRFVNEQRWRFWWRASKYPLSLLAVAPLAQLAEQVTLNH